MAFRGGDLTAVAVGSGGARSRSHRWPAVRHAAALSAVVCIGCGGGSSSPTTPSIVPTSVAAPLTGQASDPAGDALADQRLQVPPDLTSATVTVSAGTVSMSVRFAPGTIDRNTTFTQIMLDTD